MFFLIQPIFYAQIECYFILPLLLPCVSYEDICSCFPIQPLFIANLKLYRYLFLALGQVMLYVDGMNGVISHNGTIQWLYSLLKSKVCLEEERFKLALGQPWVF